MTYQNLRSSPDVSKARRKTQRLGRSRTRPRPRARIFEQLEDRALLSEVPNGIWINPNGGAWEVASNWTNNAIPGPNDDVKINFGGAVTITHGSGSDTIHSLFSLAHVVLSGG